MKLWHWIILGLVTVASIVAEFAGQHGEVSHLPFKIPLFWIWFGAGGSVVLILFGKKLFGPIVEKKEDYYND